MNPDFSIWFIVGWPILTAILTMLAKPRTPEEYAALAEKSPRLAAALQFIGALGLDIPNAMAALGKIVNASYVDAAKYRAARSMAPGPLPEEPAAPISEKENN